MRIPAIIFLVLMSQVPAMSLECFMDLLPLDNNTRMTSELEARWDKGFSPVGIEIVEDGNDRGLWVLFIKDQLSYTGWKISSYPYQPDNPAMLAEGITQNMNSGWVAFDLAFGNGFCTVLYLRIKSDITSWRIDYSTRSMDSLKEMVRRNTKSDFLPFGLSVSGSGDLGVLFHEVRGNVIKNWRLNSYTTLSDLSLGLGELTVQGWYPYGFMMQSGSIMVLLLK